MAVDVRTKLLKIAARLFAEKGYHAVSIREIAKKARVNSSLISYYFGGKYELYKAIFNEEEKKTSRMFDRTKELAPLEMILEFLNHCEKEDDPNISKMLTRAMLDSKEKKFVNMLYNDYSGVLFAEGRARLSNCKFNSKYEKILNVDRLMLFLGSMTHFWTLFSDILIKMHGFKDQEQIKKESYNFARDMIKEFLSI